VRAFLVLFMVQVAALCAAPFALQAQARPADLCRAAGDAAAERHGVPREILRAISIVETGRNGEPWPWTVNMEGAGHWFDGRAEARAYVLRRQAQGAVSFDIGCFQVNHRWHGAAFPSIDAMFEPLLNADYAARFLRTLYDETQSWSTAAGHYHSRTPELAQKYRSRFETVLANLEMEAPGPLKDRLPLITLTGAASAGAVPRAPAGATSGAVSLAFFGGRRERPLLGWASGGG
jgi:hypothetical protein